MTDPDRSAPGAAARREPAVDELRARLARFQALVEYAPDAVVILDVDTGVFESVNAAAEELFGMTRAELLRVGPVEVSPPVQPDGRPSQVAAMEHVGRALAGERPRFDWTHRRADGVDVPCEVRLLRLPSPDRRLVRGSVLDITDRREAEAARAAAGAEQVARRAAEASIARLQATVAGLNAVVWERDPDTLRLTFVNARAEQLLGYPAAQWLAEDDLWEQILHPDDRDVALAAVRSAVDSDAVDFALSYRVRAADGRRLWLQHLGHVARDESGSAHTLHGVLFDITEAVRREHAAELLAAASRALSTPGAVEQRLAAVAALAVEELADRALVRLRGDDDRYRIVAAAPAGAPGEPLLVAPDELRSRVDAGRPFTDGARLVVPLVAGGDHVGLLTLVATDRARSYDDADLALGGELGQRIAAMVAAERVAARQRQLHQLTAALAVAGTAAEAAAALTASLHEALDASVVAVCTLGEDGQLHTVDVHGDSPTWATRFATIRLSAPVPLADAARTRGPVWLADRAALLARYPDLAQHLHPSTEATASLPLVVGPHLVGALAVVFPRPRRFDAADRAFLLTVAAQVAAALERAALADIRRETADTLQRSLLPAQLPSTEGLTVSARYLPAVTGTSAGGDWYDVVPVDDGGVAVVVGDVVGHGAAAAAVMGRLSSALSGLVLAGHGPARALELLERFAGQMQGARLATVACLLLDPATGRLTYSCAGHPPPLLVSVEGAVSYLAGGHGPALGVAGAGRRAEAEATVPPGATVLLYTDGLVERRDALLDDGLERLSAVATALRTAPLPALVDGVLTALVGRDGADDDVAVLAARRRPVPLRADVPADPARLAALRRSVARWAEQAALSPEATDDLQLALGEAAANAVEHAYRAPAAPGRVLIELDSEDDGGVRAAVSDGGTWRPAAADAGFRGRGLSMIAAVADDIEVTSGADGTTLRFRLPPPAIPPVLEQPTASDPVEAPASLLVAEVRGRRCLEVLGDLDLAGVRAVRDDLLAEVAAGGKVTLDLTRTGFVASVGVGLLLEAFQSGGEQLEVVVPPGGPARRVLELTGLTETLGAHGAGTAR